MSVTDVDVVVIGAGFAGLYAHHRLRGLDLSVAGFEQAPDLGGTWWWNAYPGARCDVESLDYCYSFSPELLDEWRWSERYATQPEILAYAHHVADRFDLKRDIRFSTRVVATVFDDATERWTVETDDGAITTARFVIAAVGCLSKPKPPEFDGLADFTGQWVQTGAWPHNPVDLDGQRVIVIGTGSSAIQSIPEIAKCAVHLTVMQRTPNFSLPARNGPIPAEQEAAARTDYPAYCRRNKYSRGGIPSRYVDRPSALAASAAERQARFEEAWGLGTVAIQSTFNDLLANADANRAVADFVRGKIAEIVTDPQTAAKLSPHDHPLGTKRLCLDSDYYATFNLPHVDLVDIRADPIARITRTGVVTASGADYPADLIVFAIGFDAMTGPFLGLNISGAGGVTLRDAWAHGPVTYLGLMVAGFPNLFMVNGPGSPSVLSNMLVTIEHHVDWIVDAIAHLDETGGAMEAERQAQDAWVGEVRMIADRTLYPRANSWYNGDNVPGKPRVFLPYVGGVDTYIRRCEAITADGYRGFRLSVPVAAQ